MTGTRFFGLPASTAWHWRWVATRPPLGNHRGPPRLSPRALGRRRGRGDERADTPIRRHHRNVGERRGTQIGRVAAARKLLILVYYGLRDGEIRCLAQTG